MNIVPMNRRSFLEKSARSIAGFVLLNTSPPWIAKSLGHTTVYRERSFHTMGSVMTMSVYGESREEADEAVRRVVEEFVRVDALLSAFNPDSFISRLNSAAGREQLNADPEVVDLLLSARKFSESTGGAFDVTVEPLMRRWGFRNERRELDRVPSDRELSELLSAVGHENILVDRANNLVGLRHPRSAVDLGGIAVGWTIDRAVRILQEYGITAAFINHAGDAYALGVPEESDYWVVGIPNPDHPQEILHQMKVKDEAIATSGNYQNVVRVEDRQFGHLLDLRSGRPDSAILSMTVVAETAIEADAFSTGLYCFGACKDFPLVDRTLRTICVKRGGNQELKISGIGE